MIWPEVNASFQNVVWIYIRIFYRTPSATEMQQCCLWLTGWLFGSLVVWFFDCLVLWLVSLLVGSFVSPNCLRCLQIISGPVPLSVNENKNPWRRKQRGLGKRLSPQRGWASQTCKMQFWAATGSRSESQSTNSTWQRHYNLGCLAAMCLTETGTLRTHLQGPEQSWSLPWRCHPESLGRIVCSFSIPLCVEPDNLWKIY